MSEAGPPPPPETVAPPQRQAINLDADTAAPTGYAWEEQYKRSWDALQEDEAGSLTSAVLALANQEGRRRRIVRDTNVVQRGIIRHLCFILDVSPAMEAKDLLKPTLLEAVRKKVVSFVHEFFDQNPISQLGLLTTHDGLAQTLSPMSANPADHTQALTKKMVVGVGEPSLQNALETARAMLRNAPGHGSKEIVLISGSLTTCDPGDIYDTIEALKQEGTRCSIIGLSAELQVCKALAQRTSGTYRVVLDDAHFKECLFAHIPPPALLREEAATKHAMIKMGFPLQLPDTSPPALCACHNALVHEQHASLGRNKSSKKNKKQTLEEQSERYVAGYQCPQCLSRVCEMPCECPVCRITLISSPLLARSYHHLFPVANFVEKVTHDGEPLCGACATPFQEATPDRPLLNKRFACTACQLVVCADCEVYIPSILHNCPGCLKRRSVDTDVVMG